MQLEGALFPGERGAFPPFSSSRVDCCRHLAAAVLDII